MRVVIIGASHGGIQAALVLKKIAKDTEVILIEKKNDLSFISNGVAMKLNGLIEKLDHARYITKEMLEQQEIQVHLNTEAKEINPEEKYIVYTVSDREYVIIYDKLILATGSNQFTTHVTFPNKEKISVFKDFSSSAQVLKRLEKSNSISIIGGGYVGIELCDALKDTEKEIHLIESADTILFRYVGKEFSDILEKKMKRAGIKLHLGESVVTFSSLEQKYFVTETTTEQIVNDYVVIAVNGRSDTRLVNDFLDLNIDGTIRVNEKMQTNEEDIYAIGDAISYPICNNSRNFFVPLVNNVYKSATVAAMNILNHPMYYHVTQKTTVSNIFGVYVASTGLTKEEAIFEGMDVKSFFIQFPYQLPYIELQEEISVMFVFKQESRVLLGAQLMSEKDISQTIDTLSLAINKKVTIDELVTMDFHFNASMNHPLGIISRAAYECLIYEYTDV